MPLSSPYTMFSSVATNMPDKLTAANILKKWCFCRVVCGAGSGVVVEYLEAGSLRSGNNNTKTEFM